MSTRMNADDRRGEVIAAAAIEFAGGGYAGTSTGSIARRAGVSQPYLFQLFGTKKELFLAAVRDCFARTGDRFEVSARQAAALDPDPISIHTRMGNSYVELLLADRELLLADRDLLLADRDLLLADRDLLRLQLHAYAACNDPDVQALVQSEYNTLWQTVATVSGADPQAVQTWFANGMLINVIASVGNAQTLKELYALVPGGVAPAS